MNKIGFMQGRLVDQINGKIQSFPCRDWKQEFEIAHGIGLNLMEWTIDHEEILTNPITSIHGCAEINALSKKFNIGIKSLTGDCFMQQPFWKSSGRTKIDLLNRMDLILLNSSKIGIKFIVIPLVDNGAIESNQQKNILIDELIKRVKILEDLDLQILFETDFKPKDVLDFIDLLPHKFFNINYDIGNSASLGFDPYEEISTYGHRIMNVHIKDRLFMGTTVPLGLGAANFDHVFSELSRVNYAGNFILQTARDENKRHITAIQNYHLYTKELLIKHYGFKS